MRARLPRLRLSLLQRRLGLVILSIVVFLTISSTYSNKSTTLGTVKRRPVRPRPTYLPYLTAHIAKNLTESYRKDWQDRPHLANEIELRRYQACIEDRKKCESPNQHMVVIWNQHWVKQGVLDEWRGGEGIWGKSMYDSIKALGYTNLFGTSNLEHAVELYQLFSPNLEPDHEIHPVLAVVHYGIEDCYYNPQCIATKSHTSGIPIWKLFEMSYFPPQKPEHPLLSLTASTSLLGSSWLITGEIPLDYPNNQDGINYLGYSFDLAFHHECSEMGMGMGMGVGIRSIKPWEERPKQAYVLAKTTRFFRLSHWRNGDWKRLKKVGVRLMGAFEIENQIPVPEGIYNLGFPISSEEFSRHLGESRLLIGLGHPYTSPSPWMGLCLGTPFLNPIYKWDDDDPDNCEKWFTQHDSLRCYLPPLVYNVKVGPGENDLYQTVVDILDRVGGGFGKFIPEHMTRKAVEKRMKDWIETDWKDLAKIARESWRPEEEMDWLW